MKLPVSDGMGPQEIVVHANEWYTREASRREHDELFFVAGGSEIRSQANESTNAVTVSRRDDLVRAGVPAAIPGVANRCRLPAAVAFPSTTIAAETTCGTRRAPSDGAALFPSDCHGSVPYQGGTIAAHKAV